MAGKPLDRPHLTEPQWRLVAENLDLARWAAGRRPGDFEGNFDAALDGLIRAARLYEGRRRCKFSHFAAICMRSESSNAAKARGAARRRPDAAVLSLGHDAASTIEPAAPEPYRGDPFDDLTRRLPDRERLILALRFRDDLTHREVGERLGITKEWARRIEQRALARLREIA